MALKTSITKDEIQRLKSLLKTEFKVKPMRFYFEIIFCSFIGWICLYFASLASFGTWPFWISLLVSSLAHYRALSFIHEVAHFRDKVFGLESLYNLCIGFWFGVPAYTHRAHDDHHSTKNFGSESDPEYAEWARRPPLYLLRPFMFIPLAPLIIVLRFNVLPVLMLFLPHKVQNFILRRASTFAMNANYERTYNREGIEAAHFQDLMCAFLFVFKIVFVYFEILPVQFLLAQFLSMSFFSFLNAYRALVAHRYTLKIKNMKSVNAFDSYAHQIQDSVTIDGGALTELWAPINLRYHSLHHMFPMLPYHSLSRAHKKLVNDLPRNHFYIRTVERSFLTAFTKLLNECIKNSKRKVRQHGV